jgi:phospholipase C
MEKIIWKKFRKKAMQVSRMSLATLAITQFSLFSPLTNSAQAQPNDGTRSPIKHVMVIVGENRTFDHIFATHKPTSGASVDNLLSKGIVNEDETSGPHYWRAAQYTADVPAGGKFEMAPKKKLLSISICRHR